jgi:membrane-associated protease RseP (regulator of RpoE activity)
MRIPIALLVMSAAATAQEKRAGETVPFELKQNLVHVKAAVNGVEGLFVWDTGSGTTEVAPASAAKFGLKVEKGLAEAASVGLGRAVVRNLPIVVAEGRRKAVDGVLGFNYISRFVTTLDYRKSTIRLEPVDDAAPAKGAATAGFSYRTIGDDEANEIGVEGGVVVSRVAAGGPAEAAGLKKGDIVQEVDGRRCDTAEDWQKVLSSAKPGDVVKLSVIRDKKDVDITLTLEARK